MSLISWWKKKVGFDGQGLPMGASPGNLGVVNTSPLEQCGGESLALPSRNLAAFTDSTLEVWEDTPRISVESIWAHIQASVPVDVFECFSREKSDALHMAPGWPGNTYRMLCKVELAGLIHKPAMDELEKMLLEWA